MLLHCSFHHEDQDRPATRDEIVAAFPAFTELQEAGDDVWLADALWLSVLTEGCDDGNLDLQRGDISLTAEW